VGGLSLELVESLELLDRALDGSVLGLALGLDDLGESSSILLLHGGESSESGVVENPLAELGSGVNVVSAENLFWLSTNGSSGTSTEGASSATDCAAIGGSGQGSVSALGVGSAENSAASAKNTRSVVAVVSALPSVLDDRHQVGLRSVSEWRSGSGADRPLLLLVVVVVSSGSVVHEGHSVLHLSLTLRRDDRSGLDVAVGLLRLSSNRVGLDGSGSRWGSDRRGLLSDHWRDGLSVRLGLGGSGSLDRWRLDGRSPDRRSGLDGSRDDTGSHDRGSSRNRSDRSSDGLSLVDVVVLKLGLVGGDDGDRSGVRPGGLFHPAES
jgi:hypothetical protein